MRDACSCCYCCCSHFNLKKIIPSLVELIAEPQNNIIQHCSFYYMLSGLYGLYAKLIEWHNFIRRPEHRLASNEISHTQSLSIHFLLSAYLLFISIKILRCFFRLLFIGSVYYIPSPMARPTVILYFFFYLGLHLLFALFLSKRSKQNEMKTKKRETSNNNLCHLKWANNKDKFSQQKINWM